MNLAQNPKAEAKRAVIANANFLIGAPSGMYVNPESRLKALSKAASKFKSENDDGLLKGKEVEEWLMGSGDAVTQDNTGSNEETTNPMASINDNLSGLVSCMHNYHQQTSTDKDVCDLKSKNEEAVDDWMFHTVEEKKDEEESEESADVELDPFEEACTPAWDLPKHHESEENRPLLKEVPEVA
jgi:hypothetical protein